MTTHRTGTRKDWLDARLELFKAEKELTRRSDELARRRQELPLGDSTYGFRASFAANLLRRTFRTGR